MAIYEEAVHRKNADVPDEHDGDRFEVPLCIFTGSEAVKYKGPQGAKQPPFGHPGSPVRIK